MLGLYYLQHLEDMKNDVEKCCSVSTVITKWGAIADAPHKTIYEIKLSFSFPFY